MHSSRNILIVANGEPVGEELFKKQTDFANYIIAADGGIKSCLQYKVLPDCIIGDLDSFDPSQHNEISGVKILRVMDQETTDIQKAISYAQSLNPARIDIICSFGKRVDHTIANVLILNNYMGHAPLFMHEDFGHLSVILPGKTTIDGAKGKTVSLFALDNVSGLKLTGFEFTVASDSLSPGFIGVSNKIIGDSASITFENGRLLFYQLERED